MNNSLTKSNTLVGILNDDNTIIGKLNKETIIKNYTGGETSTATVIVDNKTNIITVDAKIDVTKVEEELKKLNERILIEKDRAIGAETNLQNAIDTEQERAEIAEKLLQSNLDVESSERIAEDTSLSNRINQEIEDRTNAVKAEETRAVEAETKLTDDLNTETTNRINADTEIKKDLASEINRATTRENEIDTKLSEEISRAKDAEKTLTDDLNTEIETRKSEDKNLTDNLNNEISRATQSETYLQNALDTEISDRKSAISQEVIDRNAAIKVETNRATQAESTLTQSLETETSERKDADTKLSSRVRTIEDDYLTSADKTELQTNINAEVTRATTTEGNLNNLSTDSKDNLVNAINWEVSERESNVSTLTTNLQKEVDRATEAEDTLTKNLNTETTNRTNADTNLQSQLDTEVSTRKSADDTLTTNLNTEISNRQSAITSEKEAREKADAALEEKKADLDLVTGKYSLITETGNKIDLSINSSTYELQAKLYDKYNNLISYSTIIDLPIESSVVKIDFNKDTNTLTFTLRNGTVTEVPLSSIITGLATETYVDNKVQSEADLRSSADTTLTNNLNSEISRAKAAEALKEDKSNLKDFAYTNYGAGTVSSKTISGVKASGNVTGTASVTLKQTSTNATLTKSDYTPSGSITGTALSNTTLSDPVTELFAKSGITVDVEDETLSFTIAPTGSAVTKQGTLTNTQATLGFTGNKTSVVSGVTYDKASVNDATISIGQVSLDVGDIVVPSETVIVSPGEDPIDASEVKY